MFTNTVKYLLQVESYNNDIKWLSWAMSSVIFRSIQKKLELKICLGIYIVKYKGKANDCKRTHCLRIQF